LRVILKAAKLVRADGKIALCNSNAQIHEVLEISGFLDMLDHYGSLEEAMQSVAD
jgi:anti-anti-sigma regulatory factor